MSTSCRPAAPALLLVVAVLANAAAAAEPECCPYVSATTARTVVDAVNALAATDIPIPVADTAACELRTLPRTLAELIAVLPPEYRQLVGECARGRTRTMRDVTGFDLLGIIEQPADRPADASTIRAFFDERTVDVATGRGASDGPYPIAFDWVVVLDHRGHRIFSFVPNCAD